MASFNFDPDLIFLTEVWVNSCELNSLQIHDYTILDACNNQYRSGGVVAYVRKGLKFTYTKKNLP